MGLFRKKNEEVKDSPESQKNDEIEDSIENLQKEFQIKQEQVDEITRKLEQVKEEYNSVVSNLMSVKKEVREKDFQLEALIQHEKSIKDEIQGMDNNFTKNKKLIFEIKHAEKHIEELDEKIQESKEEYEKIQEEIIKSRGTINELKGQEIFAQREVELIKSKLNNQKQQIKNTVSNQENKFVSSSTDNAPKNVIQAASVVINSMKLKVDLKQKELEIVQRRLENERKIHNQTKKELEDLKNKIKS